MTTRPLALELFAGIGGFSASVQGHMHTVAAIDMSSHTLAAIAKNFPDVSTTQKDVSRLTPDDMRAYGADLWWMSPPCQPYTVRGHQQDLQDRRAQSLLHVLDLVAEVQPAHLAMENVKGFWDSMARGRVLEVLAQSGYEVSERIVCPSTLGVPARRERYYLVASREGLIAPEQMGEVGWPTHALREYLDAPEDVDPELYVSDEDRETFAHAMRIFDWDAPDVSLNCFTSAYGKTFRYSGAFVREQSGRVRYFSAAELLRLLHFPDAYRLPEVMTRRQRYKYVGNSLSVRAMREVLRALPVLGDVAH